VAKIPPSRSVIAGWRALAATHEASVEGFHDAADRGGLSDFRLRCVDGGAHCDCTG